MGTDFRVAAEAKTLSNTAKSNWPYDSSAFRQLASHRMGPAVSDGSSAGGRRHVILLATIESFDMSPSYTEIREQERKKQYEPRNTSSYLEGSQDITRYQSKVFVGSMQLTLDESYTPRCR